MLRSLLPPARRAPRPAPTRSARRGLTAWAALGLVATATMTAPAIGPAAATAADTETHPTFAASYLSGVSGPRPERIVSLAGTWGFTPVTDTVCVGGGPFGTSTGPMTCTDSPASGEDTTIQVPGGGWLKQGWTDLSVARYHRTIRVPNIPNEQVTRLNFGAINHRATLWVDGELVGTQTTSYTNSVFDITDYVRPGKTAEIELLVRGRKALVGPDGRYTVPEGASWSDDVAQGIFRSADLEVYPAVYVSDTVVRTSVEDKELSYDVSLTNATTRPQRASLRGSLGSANGSGWRYPELPTRDVVVPAGATTTVTVTAAWKAPEASYWWPNLPYRAGYRAQLHNLDVRLDPREPAMRTSTAHVRFGFREIAQTGDHFELNGRRINFRGDSIQGANYDNIDHHGVSDAYDTLPGFLAPSSGNPGWPQAVDNYLRLNFSSVRIHQIPASPYMLDVADEMGLMIQDETAIRGSNNRENFVLGRGNMVKHLADLVKRDRNHASVLRWSQANEPRVVFFTNPGAGPDFDEALYQTVMGLDQTRPISTDGDSFDLPSHDNYTVFCHYDGFSFGAYSESICAGPTGKPQGQGEFLWYADSTPQGFAWFGTSSMRMREQGADEIRPYTLLSAWSSFVPGVKRTDMTLEIGYPNGPHPIYGEDNLPDPWANPTIKLIQNAFNPVATIDTAFWNANKMSDAAGAWPTAPPVISPGATTRQLTMFNDTLSGEDLELTWSLRLGSPTGAVIDQGSVDATIPLGTSQQTSVTFVAPATHQELYLDLKVSKPGAGLLYQDTSTVFTVQAPA